MEILQPHLLLKSWCTQIASLRRRSSLLNLDTSRYKFPVSELIVFYRAVSLVCKWETNPSTMQARTHAHKHAQQVTNKKSSIDAVSHSILIFQIQVKLWDDIEQWVFLSLLFSEQVRVPVLHVCLKWCHVYSLLVLIMGYRSWSCSRQRLAFWEGLCIWITEHLTHWTS